MRLAVALIFITLCGCELTGDPRKGGLFGWSAAKARARQAERAKQLARAKRRLADETSRTQALNTRESGVKSELANADANQRLRLERLERQYAATLQRAKALEDEAFTSASSSRARRLRAEVETTGGDSRLSPEERIARLRALDRELESPAGR